MSRDVVAITAASRAVSVAVHFQSSAAETVGRSIAAARSARIWPPRGSVPESTTKRLAMANGYRVGTPVEFDLSNRVAQAQGSSLARSLKARFDDLTWIGDYTGASDTAILVAAAAQAVATNTTLVI